MNASGATCSKNDQSGLKTHSFAAALSRLSSFLNGFFPVDVPENECLALAVAALNGHPHAEYLVGSAYEADENDAEARLWYERAARQGFVPAMLQLQQYAGSPA